MAAKALAKRAQQEEERKKREAEALAVQHRRAQDAAARQRRNAQEAAKKRAILEEKAAVKEEAQQIERWEQERKEELARAEEQELAREQGREEILRQHDIERLAREALQEEMEREKKQKQVEEERQRERERLRLEKEQQLEKAVKDEVAKLQMSETDDWQGALVKAAAEEELAMRKQIQSEQKTGSRGQLPIRLASSGGQRAAQAETISKGTVREEIVKEALALRISGPGNAVRTIGAWTTTSGRQAKALIEQVTYIPREAQRLFLNAIELHDDILLGSIFPGGAVAFLTLELRDAEQAKWLAKVEEATSKMQMNELKEAPEIVRADPNIMLAAVRMSGMLLRNASKELQADRDVVLSAVRQDGYALEYAAAELQADREIVSTAIQQKGDALQFASEDLRADRQLVLEAIGRDYKALQYAQEDLRNTLRYAVVDLPAEDKAPATYPDISTLGTNDMIPCGYE